MKIFGRLLLIMLFAFVAVASAANSIAIKNGQAAVGSYSQDGNAGARCDEDGKNKTNPGKP